MKSDFVSANDSYKLIQNIKINPENLDFNQYTYTLKVRINEFSSNLSLISSKIDHLYQDNIKVHIISSKPIDYNTITDNQTLTSGQISAPFTSLSPYVDFTINCNRRGCIPIYDYRYITNFQWQTRTQSTEWTNIPQATQKDYSPNKSFTENTYYRRVAFYNDGQYNISNTISIIYGNGNFQNTICCDQSLPFKNSQPQKINGDQADSNIYTYQWQSAKYSRGTTLQSWYDIIGATSQNYQHTFPQDAVTNEEKTAFRRLVKLNSLPVSTSNFVTISRYTEGVIPPTRRDGTSTMLPSQSLSSFDEANENNTIIYPNPFTNNLSIDGPISIDNVKIYDSFGQAISINKTQYSKDKIEINTPNLKSGVYILKIDNTTFSKTLIKN